MKLSKADLKDLRAFCKKLPPTFSEYNEKFVVVGHDIVNDEMYATLRDDLIKEDEDLDKKFMLQRTNFIPVNHYRRVKRLLQKSGDAAADQYINEVLGIFAGHQNMMNSINQLPEQRARELAASALVCLETLT